MGSDRRDGMTDISGTAHNQTQDYFGAAVATGPSRGRADSEDISPGRGPGVPDPPANKAAPVEMDSTARVDPSVLSPVSASSVAQTPVSENIHGRFELYGSDSVDNPNRPSSIVPTPPQSPLRDNSRRTEQLDR